MKHENLFSLNINPDTHNFHILFDKMGNVHKVLLLNSEV